MKYGLSDQQLAVIRSFFAKEPKIEEAVLFGSRAMDTFKEASDIDLAIKGDSFDFFMANSLKSRLEDETDIPFFFDIIAYTSIKSEELRRHIREKGVVIYRRGMGGWKECKFSDFVVINPSVKLEKGKRYSFVEMKDLTNGQKKCYHSQKRILTGGSKFQNGDTLFAKITPCLENGKICQVNGLKNGVGFGSTEFYVFRGKENVSDNEFVFYLSRWSEVRNFAEMNFDGTSGRQRVPKSSFDSLLLKLPPLPEQKAIASVLSSLDDKIDLLHRQNKTLEAMAETLFRQWFVVEAGEGWEKGVLDSVLSVKGGTTPSTKNSEYWDGEIHWTAPRDLSGNQHIYLFDTGRKITEKGLAKISSGLLPVGTILLSSRAPIGYLAISDIPVAINQGYIAIVDNKGYSKYFLYLWVKNNLDYIISNANGSTFLEITKSVFKSLEIVKPPVNLRKNFDKQVVPIFQKIKTSSIQIRTLEKLRDTLLPKLMSGEVRVKMGV